MTVVNTRTRLVWRGTVHGAVLSTAPYFDVVSAAKPYVSPRFFTLTYIAEPADFAMVEAHTELGGHAVAFREGVVYAVFTEQDGPGFAELWQDVSYHLVVSIEEVEDGSEGQTDRT